MLFRKEDDIMIVPHWLKKVHYIKQNLNFDPQANVEVKAAP